MNETKLFKKHKVRHKTGMARDKDSVGGVLGLESQGGHEGKFSALGSRSL